MWAARGPKSYPNELFGAIWALGRARGPKRHRNGLFGAIWVLGPARGPSVCLFQGRWDPPGTLIIIGFLDDSFLTTELNR